MQLKDLQLKRALRIALLVLLLSAVGMTNVFAANPANHDFTSVAPNGQTLYYKITSSIEHTVMVTHPNSSSYNNFPYGSGNNYYQGNFYTKPSGNLIIPYYVEYNGVNYSVTAIDEYAFGTTYSDYSGYGPFACTGLTSVVIPSSVLTIGNQAFARCTGLTTVTIPTSVISIGNDVFRYCRNLVAVNFNATNCSSVGSNTWDGCSSFTTLNLGNSVTRIPNNGFDGATQLTSVTIPKKVNTIGDGGFKGCTSLTNVTIKSPSTLTTIGNYAFDGCLLLQSTTDSQLLPNTLQTIGDYAFQNASTLAYIRIPSTVTSIGKYAFKSCTALNTVDFEATNCISSGTQAEPPFFDCSGLTTVNVDDNVTRISVYCFKDCTSLVNLTLHNGLSEIGAYAFYCCMNINSLVLPASVTSIGSFAFGNAYDMEIANVVSLNAIPPTIGEEAVFPAVQTIYVPWASVSDYESAEYWEDYFIEGMAYKSIPAHGTTSGWHFIASPLVASTAPNEIDNMIAETESNFDLYRFNQSAELEWENWKSHANNDDHYHFNLTNGQGYLYANAEDVNLIFKGNFNENETKEVELIYDANADLPGWNLVGNPFPVSAYANRSYYVMNEDGTAIEPVAVSMETPIPACTGVMVKADAAGETVIFSKTAPEAAANQGVLQIAVAQANQRGASTGSATALDKAIVSFNAGDHLEKFVFNKENATLSIPQGGKDFAIASAEKMGEMLLNFKVTKNGEYTISVNPEAVEMDYLHLIDNMTGNDINLLTTPSYSFNANTTDYASRFKLVFSTTNEDGLSTGSGTFAFIDASGNIILTADAFDAFLQVADMTGRVMGAYSGHIQCVPTTGMAPGVYVLSLRRGDDVKTQKIIVR